MVPNRPSLKHKAAVFAGTIREHARRFELLSRPESYRELTRLLTRYADEDEDFFYGDDSLPELIGTERRLHA